MPSFAFWFFIGCPKFSVINVIFFLEKEGFRKKSKYSASLTYLGDTKSIDIHIILKYWEFAKKFCLYVDGVLRVLYVSQILITEYFHMKHFDEKYALSILDQ